MPLDFRRVSLLVTLSSVAISIPCNADHLVEFEQIRTAHRGEELLESEQRSVKAWLGDQQARLDRGRRVSFILRSKEEVLLALDHERKTYMVFHLPIEMEDYLDEEAAKALRQAAEHLVPNIDIRRLDEVADVLDWTARRHLLDVRMPGGQILFAGEFWLSQDVPEILSRYEELMKTVESFSQIVQQWKHRILDLEGVVVLLKKLEDRRGARITTLQTLKGVREVETDAKRYGVPDGYQRVDVDPRVFGHVGPGSHLTYGTGNH